MIGRGLLLHIFALAVNVCYLLGFFVIRLWWEFRYYVGWWVLLGLEKEGLRIVRECWFIKLFFFCFYWECFCTRKSRNLPLPPGGKNILYYFFLIWSRDSKALVYYLPSKIVLLLISFYFKIFAWAAVLYYMGCYKVVSFN